ncbi:RagB/SusD family nutrient uptake outer membrane protein [Chitinophaga lutea]|uniref:RagB/SusD family nutrient uptake outer membrane protein n=2 Tax=Chitinophaga lutea TaxID=2488634 RepID=A0A3N4PYM4_9BACT|nr:RagB/SusD family nutrient uptake outer membrane protein [Chitinophaga lutea]
MKEMKKYIVFVAVLLVAMATTPGCKKFLDTESPTRESGASFWKTRADAERFTNNLYGEMADILLNNSFFLAAEFRCGLYRQTRVYPRDYFDWFPVNNIKSIVYGNNYWNGFFHFDRLIDWNPYFKIIQSAGILIDRAPGVPDSELSPEEKKQYVAEGVFVRNFCYFLMVRLYGDVPYYTKPYFDKVIGRSNFVEVLNQCIAELDKYKNDLPWSYPDPRKRAVRPTVGTMYALMMHMNMWNAGFDDLNRGKYHEHAAALFKEFEGKNNGTYRLLTTAEFTRLFRGGSEEGLFEFSQNVNYGELRGLGYQYLNDNVIRGGYDRPYLYLQKKFLEKMYPLSDPDKRRDIWFDGNMMSESRGEFLKFSGNRGSGSGYDGSLIVFRLADMYLLAAEANAELGSDRSEEAIRLLNVIRGRAEAPAYSGVTQRDLQDAIYWERTKELMGEGHYFYDLVRTKRILNSEYCAFPISQPAFQRGAWTWPITEEALKNNPLMRLNEYWR